MSDSRAQPHSEEAVLRAERGRLSQELVGLYEGGGCLQGLEDLAGLLEDGAGFAGPAELGEAAALAEQGERLLGNNPEGLPTLGGVGVPLGRTLQLAASLGEGGVCGGEGVLSARGARLDPGHQPLRELPVAERDGCAHHRREERGVLRSRAGTRAALDLDEQGGGLVILSECGAGEGGRDQVVDEVVDLPCFAGRGFQRVERVRHLSCLSAQSQDANLHHPHPGELEHVPARLELGGELGGEGKRPLVLARRGEHIDRVDREDFDHRGEPASLGEGGPCPAGLQGCGGALNRPERRRKVDLQDGDLPPLPGLSGERDRLPVVVEAAPVAEVVAGQGAIAESAGRPGQAKLPGQGQRTLGVAEAKADVLRNRQQLL